MPFGCYLILLIINIQISFRLLQKNNSLTSHRFRRILLVIFNFLFKRTIFYSLMVLLGLYIPPRFYSAFLLPQPFRNYSARAFLCRPRPKPYNSEFYFATFSNKIFTPPPTLLYSLKNNCLPLFVECLQLRSETKKPAFISTSPRITRSLHEFL